MLPQLDRNSSGHVEYLAEACINPTPMQRCYPIQQLTMLVYLTNRMVAEIARQETCQLVTG